MAARVDALTGVRALSALAVFLYHAGLFPWGYTGVDLFFCLSGFVLTLNYASAFPSLTAARYLSFLRARLARVWPLHAFTFLLAVPYYFATGGGWDWKLPVKALINLTLVHSVSPRGVWLFNQVSWSLSNEWLFYAAFPFLCAYLLPRLASHRWLMATVAALALLTGVTIAVVTLGSLPAVRTGWGAYLLYYCPAFRVLEFLTGCLFGKLFLLNQGQQAPAAARLVVPSALLAVLAVGAVHGNSDAPLLLTAVYAAPFSVFIYVLARSTPSGLTRFLGGRAMVALGEWSFAFYMLHWLVLRYYELASFPAAPALLVPATLLASLLLAALSYRWVEVPFRKRIRRSLAQ
jgi:peptidoglycan/LPS O-acetylase OafA/YrhL